jgi:hypothetical protein
MFYIKIKNEKNKLELYNIDNILSSNIKNEFSILPTY